MDNFTYLIIIIGLTIFIILNLYLYFEEGLNFYKNYKKVGKSGLVGGIGLGIAMISFIYSITNTTAAITLLCLAAMPFFTAILAYIFLKEKISINVWVSIIIATIGIIIMALGNTEKNSLISSAKIHVGNHLNWTRFNLYSGFSSSTGVIESSIGVGLLLSRFEVVYGLRFGSQNIGIPQIISIRFLMS